MINQINPELSVRLNGTLSELNSEVKKLKHISEIYNEIVFLKDELSNLKNEHVESSELLALHISDSLKFYTNTLTRMSNEHELIKNATLNSADSNLQLSGVTVDLVSMNDISIHIHELLDLNDTILNTIQNYNTSLNDIILSLSKNENENNNLINLNNDILKINKVNNTNLSNLIEKHNSLNLILLENYKNLNNDLSENYKNLNNELSENYILLNENLNNKFNDVLIDIDNKFISQTEIMNNFEISLNTNLNNKFIQFQNIAVEAEDNFKKEINLSLLKQYKIIINFYKKQNKIAIIINVILYLTLLGIILFK